MSTSRPSNSQLSNGRRLAQVIADAVTPSPNALFGRAVPSDVAEERTQSTPMELGTDGGPHRYRVHLNKGPQIIYVYASTLEISTCPNGELQFIFIGYIDNQREIVGVFPQGAVYYLGMDEPPQPPEPQTTQGRRIRTELGLSNEAE